MIVSHVNFNFERDPGEVLAGGFVQLSAPVLPFLGAHFEAPKQVCPDRAMQGRLQAFDIASLYAAMVKPLIIFRLEKLSSLRCFEVRSFSFLMPPGGLDGHCRRIIVSTVAFRSLETKLHSPAKLLLVFHFKLGEMEVAGLVVTVHWPSEALNESCVENGALRAGPYCDLWKRFPSSLDDITSTL